MSTKKLQELFENSVLNDESKTVVQEAFDAAVEEKLSTLREAEELKVAQKLVEAREQFADEMVGIIREAVESEVEALKEEVAQARTLEERYAEKLVAFKEKFYESATAKMDEAVAAKIQEEMDELRETMEEARKNEMGRKIFEACKSEILEQGLVDESDLKSVQEIKSQMDEQAETIDKLQRELKLKEMLESVTVEKRDVVSTMLEDVATDKLEAKFEKIMESMATETKEEESLEESEKEEQLDESAVVISETKFKDDKKAFDYKRAARLAAGFED